MLRGISFRSKLLLAVDNIRPKLMCSVTHSLFSHIKLKGLLALVYPGLTDEYAASLCVESGVFIPV